MAILEWDKEVDRLYETGVKKCVLYVQDDDGTYPEGVAWNGITAITESPSGAEATPLYADDIKYLNLISAETFGATVEAYMYPKEFEQCDGTADLDSESGIKVTVGQQFRKTFGLSYITTLGNAVKGNNFGYKIHIIYGATAAPSEKAYNTINESPEAITFSWELNTIPTEVGEGLNPTSTVVITVDYDTQQNTDKMTKINKLLGALHGTDSATAYLPTPSEIRDLLA